MSFPVSNLLLQSLPSDAHTALASHFEIVDLPVGTVLFLEEQPARYAPDSVLHHQQPASQPRFHFVEAIKSKDRFVLLLENHKGLATLHVKIARRTDDYLPGPAAGSGMFRFHTGLTNSVQSTGPPRYKGLSDRMNAGTSSPLTQA